MKKILFVTTLLPYPLNNGGKIKTFNTLTALSEKYKIDLLCYITNKDEFGYFDKLKTLVETVEVVRKNLIRNDSTVTFLLDYFKSLFSSNSYNVSKFYTKQFEANLKNKIMNNNYDFIYVDHLPMMAYMRAFKGKLILDQHNVESLILKRMFEQENSFFKKSLGKIEYLKLRRFEKKAMNRADKIIALSSNDKQLFIEMGITEEKISVLPIHLTLDKEYLFTKPSSRVKILFLGSMSWFPNQSGIKWFVEKVWVKLNPENFQLYIVGGNPPNFIKEYHDNENIIVTGYVDDVDDFIRRCDVSIVPLFIGSGQRVKIIESFAKNIPVVSTSIGAEGLIYKNKDNILIADSSNEFVAILENLYRNPGIMEDIANGGKENFEVNYSATHLPKKLERILNSIGRD